LAGGNFVISKREFPVALLPAEQLVGFMATMVTRPTAHRMVCY